MESLTEKIQYNQTYSTKKKILHIVNKNALGGGIGTVIDYLNKGLNSSEDFQSDTLLTDYQVKEIGKINNENKYLFRQIDSTLKKHDKEGKEIESLNKTHSDLEKTLEEYDVIHVHGIPNYGILEHLNNVKNKKNTNKKTPKIINTAHSSVKQEMLAHYLNIKEEAKNNNQLKSEEDSLKYLLENNILNDPTKFGETFWGSAIYRQEKIMTLADSVQHMNEAYKKQIINEYSAQENEYKHTIIPNGVQEVNSDKPREKKKRMLFVGRFAKEKGIDELVDSIPYILEKHPDAEIKFVGGDKEGKIVEEYKNRAKEKLEKYFGKRKAKEILNKIHFTGWVTDRNELQKHYEWSDFVLIPSHAESFSLTASEALMYGRVPVMTATPALKDLYIDKGIGLGIDPEKRNAQGIAETLNEILKKDESSNEYDELVEKGKKFVKENYSFEKMIDNQKKLYDFILDKN